MERCEKLVAVIARVDHDLGILDKMLSDTREMVSQRELPLATLSQPLGLKLTGVDQGTNRS